MSDHFFYMKRALDLAQQQAGRTAQNPSVGCVILDREGRKISEAATGDGGRPHAEQLALADLPAGSAAGGTVYVTLEPCRERSTGEDSCSTQLLSAGIAKVIIATRDPHPLGQGGIDRLRDAGVQVELGLLRDEADALYADFFALQVQTTP
ncbi:MAG: bifunctional diaminohydroxyphosphoribosylaminopyrimidine deaminase/5-amino-6-(5-phosphoribosylamino)uracil reductase RibD [Pseudomonadota bacterium]